MKKVIISLMLIVILAFSSCGFVDNNTKILEDTRSRYIYFHDEIHHVGLWWDRISGGSCVLPDSEYDNVGITMQGEPVK